MPGQPTSHYDLSCMLSIGVDCGTQGIKAVAWDIEKARIWTASQSYDLIADLPPGHKEQHPRAWIDGLENCMGSLRQQGLDFSRVEGIGVSGQQHGLVALDQGHRVIRPAKLWNDTSTAGQCEQIMDTAGGPEAYQREIGNLLPPGYTASKILWLNQNEPGNYGRLRHILLPHDYLNLFLTGELVSEFGDASGTGYFRVREREWSQAALEWIDEDIDLFSFLPRLIDSRSPAGALRPELAEKWGMSSSPLVSSGGGDNMMGAIGSGNMREGMVTVSLGTSGTLYTHAEVPVIDPEGDIAAFCGSTGGWLPLGCTMNVTVATEAVRQGFLDCSFEELETHLASVPAGSDGLVVLPYLEGERMPNTPAGTGTVLGLRGKTATPQHLARATVEGVTFGLRYGFDRLRELGVSGERLCLIGGGSRSSAWRQITADVFGVPVVAPAIEEGAAFGAALQAGWCVRGGSIQDLVDEFFHLNPGKACQPSRETRGRYEATYRLYCRLSDDLRQSPIFPAHRELISNQENANV